MTPATLVVLALLAAMFIALLATTYDAWWNRHRVLFVVLLAVVAAFTGAALGAWLDYLRSR